LDRIRNRPADFKPDPDPACYITECVKKIKNVFKKKQSGGTKISWA